MECLLMWFTLFRFAFCFGCHSFGENSFENTGPRQGNLVTPPAADTEVLPSGQILPGIHNAVTLEHIVPKLPWTAFRDLYAVNSHWAEAIEGGLVYAERVRHQITDTVVVYVNCIYSGNLCPGNFHSLGIYSTRNSFTRDLPPIPGVPTGIPYHCQCISLGGKLYVMGGAETINLQHSQGCSQVYVFDTLGSQGWRQGASMHEPRYLFGAGVTNGKIYVFGGVSDGKPVRGSEVFDPKVDAWSPVTSMPSLRIMHRVSTFDNEIFVHGGWFFEGPAVDRVERIVGGNGNSAHVRMEIERLWANHQKQPSFLEVYNPARDEWRSIEGFGTDNRKAYFVSSGSFFALGEDGLHRYEAPTNTWLLTQNMSLSAFVPAAPSDVHLQFLAAVVVDGELIALVFWSYVREDSYGIFLLQSKYFGSSRDIEWEFLERCYVSGIRNFQRIVCSAFGCAPFLCSVEL